MNTRWPELIQRYPKTRPPLPDGIRAIHTAHYIENRVGGSPASALSRRIEYWLHGRVARDVKDDPAPRSTLEIGAGTLNQLDFEPAVGPYDIVEPFEDLYRNAPGLRRIRNIYGDIRNVPAENRYDRITSIATFEHVCDLPNVVGRTGLLLADGGVLRVSIPSEGTLMWGLAWRLTTGLEFRMRHGQDYGLLLKHEHVNTAAEIEGVLRFFYRNVRGACLGPCKQLSFYQYFECRDPDRGLCADYVRSTGNQTSG